MGAYGPYIKGPGRRNNAKIDKDLDPAKITEQEAKKMLAEYKPRKMPRRTGKRKAPKKK
ncbi:hypothetical protein FACS189431_8160 [Alphaproteobacteria bacterium]|nr:hypothetical protein FACS189431_8160 [Alphaproteobacteria bacterium]